MGKDERQQKQNQRKRPPPTHNPAKAHATAIFKPRNLAVSAPLVVPERKEVKAGQSSESLEEPSAFEGLNWSQVRASRLEASQSPVAETQNAEDDEPQPRLGNGNILKWALALRSSPALDMSRVWFSFQREVDAKSGNTESRRPKRIIRAGRDNGSVCDQAADQELMERVCKALRHSKQRQCAPGQTAACKDIFANVGVFDPSAAIPEGRSSVPAKKPLNKTAQKLFKKPVEAAKAVDPSNEPSVFDLIAGKALDAEATDEAEKLDEPEATAGGLFGFSAMLPKLGRLAEESKKRAHVAADDNAYADILNDNGANDDAVRLGDIEPVDTYLEEDDDFAVDEIGYDTTKDEADPDTGNGKGSARKLRRKEAKEATAIERILTSKYNMKL